MVLNNLKAYKKFFVKENKTKKFIKTENTIDQNLVFLIGFPRSGTTLLDSIIRSHSKTLVLEEKPFLLPMSKQ